MNKEELLDLCTDAKRIGISGHIRPDGDCICACMSLFQYLKKVYPNKVIRIFLETPPKEFEVIEGIHEIDSTFPEEKPFDVLFALDCGKERLGEAEKYFDTAKMTVNIDHHISNATGTGVKNHVVPEASSTSELIFDLIKEEYLDGKIAKILYIGVIHDTGVFQYSNTSPKTLLMVSKLISFGFDFPKLIEETFYEKTYVQTQIMGRALLEAVLFMDGQCVVSMVDKKTMDFYQATSADLDGIVSQLRQIKGVECAVFMYETDTLRYKVSLRSGGKVNVAKIAEFFSGGGHARAAGCTMNGTYHDVVNNLSLHIEEELKGE